MKEIKFRAWVPPMGQDKEFAMIEGVQPLFADPVVPIDGKEFCMIPLGGLTFVGNSPRGAQGKRYWIEIPVDAIMQYTGLKDRNGKEIYEGDIVVEEIETGKYQPFVVKWHDDYAGFDMSSSPCWTILGNIYENPELL